MIALIDSPTERVYDVSIISLDTYVVAHALQVVATSPRAVRAYIAKTLAIDETRYHVKLEVMQ